MDLVVIFCLCMLASSKVTLQGLFAKKNVKTSVDGIFFNGIIFLFSSLIFAKNIINCHWYALVFGFIFGILTTLFQLCYIKAMSSGAVSLTVLIVNLSMIIPIAVSVAVFGEKLTITKIIGLVLTVVALVTSIDRGEKSEKFKKWFVLSLLAFLANGALAVTQQMYGKVAGEGESSAFVAWSYLTATLLSAAAYVILRLRGNSTSFKIKPGVFGIGLCVGVVLGAFQFLNTRAVATIDGLLLFPVYYGGSLIISSLFGLVFLKDRLKTNQTISIITGIIAIIITNL